MMATTVQESSFTVFQLLLLLFLLLLVPLIVVVWKWQYQHRRPLSLENQQQQFTHSIVVKRHLPNKSPQQAYARCLRAWRVDNLGLPKPPFSFLQPKILQPGNATTGVGFIIQRWMPLGCCCSCHLQEGIVGFQENAPSPSSSSSSAQKTECWMQMEYRVMNPSICTWPVYNHLGRVRFTATGARSSNNNKESGVGCQMEWTVQWTPLPLPMIPYWDNILTCITTMVIETAGNYMATEEEEQQQDDAKNR